MSSLQCLFIVQGEGRGHMTQALALRALLARAGHQVIGVLMGQNARREVPEFFLRKIEAPVVYLESPTFVCDAHNRSVRPLASLLHTARRTPGFRRSLRRIETLLKEYRPDVVINFFEPLGGLYYGLYRPAIPMVCIAHQYLFLHPSYRFPPGHLVERSATRLFTRLTALGATRMLALSLYPVPEPTPQSTARMTVLPPLLRDELLRQHAHAPEAFLLAYLLNSGYADEIIRWHRQYPEQILHCFWDNRAAARVERYDATLTFHRLDDEKFLGLMARCQGLVTTAGFETVCEAMYLGKPVLAVPVEGHFEQYCNSLDAVAAGAGLACSHFDIDRLVSFMPSYRSPAPAFRRWTREAEARFVRAIETAAAQAPAPVADPLAELATV